MDSAKVAVKGIMTKPGQHDTIVYEEVTPAVQNETVEKQKHEPGSKATAQRDAISLDVVREASRRDKVKAKSQGQR
jgi:ribosomal protein L20A (L18A)